MHAFQICLTLPYQVLLLLLSASDPLAPRVDCAALNRQLRCLLTLPIIMPPTLRNVTWMRYPTLVSLSRCCRCLLLLPPSVERYLSHFEETFSPLIVSLRFVRTSLPNLNSKIRHKFKSKFLQDISTRKYSWALHLESKPWLYGDHTTSTTFRRPIAWKNLNHQGSIHKQQAVCPPSLWRPNSPIEHLR